MRPQYANLKIGLVGATGVVGRCFLQIIDEWKWNLAELRPFASEQSLGKTSRVGGREWPNQILKADCFKGLDLVFFSSGDEISLEWGPQAQKAGAWVVDNSAAFRMNPMFPLVVPEVNADLLKGAPTIVANPNCSTIQLVTALEPLKKFGLSQVLVSSYQSVSGAGQPGVDELLLQVGQVSRNEQILPKVFSRQIAFNCVPQIGSFDSEGFTTEENKVIFETRKILNLPELPVSVMTVRIPAANSHSEAVWVTLDKVVTREELILSLKSAPGLVVQEDPKEFTTAIAASGTDPVYVGRIHQDRFNPKMWMMWIVADNLRKGAALNGLQIAKAIFK